MRKFFRSRRVPLDTRAPLYHLMLNAAADPIIVLDRMGFVRYMNPATEKASGYDISEMLGRHFARLGILEGDSLIRALKTFDAALREQPCPPYELRFRRKDGSYMIGEVNVNLVKTGQEFIGLQCVVRDVTRYVETERLLREERDKTQRYLDIAGVMILALDLQGRVTLINARGSEILGRPQEEIVGRDWFEHFLPPSMRADVRQMFQKLVEGCLPENERAEGLVLTSRGEERLISWHNSLLRDGQGRVTGTLSSGGDITEFKRAQALVNLQSAALEAAANAFVITDVEGTVIWVNPAFAALTGYTLEDVRGGNPRILKSGHHDTVFYKKLWDTILSGKVWQHEMVNRRKDGTFYTEEMIITPVFDERRTITNFIAVKQDISKRKWAEESLHQQFAFLQTLIDTIPNPIFYNDLEGRFLGCNKAFAHCSGLEQEEIRAKTIFDVFPSEIARQQSAVDYELAAQGGVRTFECRMPCHGGMHVMVFYKAPFAAREGGVVGVIVDITERKAMEDRLASANKELVNNERVLRNLVSRLEKAHQELKEAQDHLLQTEKMAAIGVLSAGIAHEIKNPLAIIILAIEQLQKASKDKGQNYERHMEIAMNAAERANKIVVELLKFSRYTKAVFETVHLHDLIQTAMELAQHKTKVKGVQVLTAFHPQDITLAADPILLEQVILNLLTNAVDAVAEGGEIRIVTALEPTGDVRIDVEDNGCGIPEEEMSRIFEPFYTTKEQGHGTGLGLSTIYMILQKHHGTIRVTSEVGRGTRFTVLLPGR